jgi:hypothetical protein
MAANATHFCLRTERTNPLIVSGFDGGARDEDEVKCSSCETEDDRRAAQLNVALPCL